MDGTDDGSSHKRRDAASRVSLLSSLQDGASGNLLASGASAPVVPCGVGGNIGKNCNRHRPIFALAAAALLLCTCADAASPALSPFGGRASTTLLFVSPISRRSSLVRPSMSIRGKTPQQRRDSFNLDTTWSNAVREKSELNESRFGVRKRVRNVLDKAKKRTGGDSSSTATATADGRGGKAKQPDGINGESAFARAGASIVAETASIGGLGAVVVDDEGGVDVALDYISKGDKQSVRGSNDTVASGDSAMESPSSGEKYEDPAILTKYAAGSKAKNGVSVSGPSPSPSKASVPSMSPVDFQRPEDDFVIRNRSAANDTSAKYVEKEAFTGDVSAAFSLPREPLPFELPDLDAEQSRRLIAGERVQYQDDMGRAGSGFVVWDVKAPASVVWDCLLDFQSYPQTIPTVREVVMYTNTHLKEDYRAERPLDFEDGTAAICKHGVPSVTRAQFSLSKFRLKIAAVHKYRPHPKGDYMIFTLDPASTNVVLKYAKGIWYTQSNPDGKEGHTRVWLLCELRVSRLLPQWIVDYAAARAMPRATTWLKPQTEAAAMLWLKDSAER